MRGTLFWICLFLIKLLIANEYNFRSITSSEGLSQNNVNWILQDKRGFIWLATLDGLNRFDGYTFKTYQTSVDNPNSMSSNLTHSLTEDDHGNIWITLENDGISILNTAQESFINFPKDESIKQKFSSLMMDNIVCFPDGNTWFNSNTEVYHLKKNKDTIYLTNYSTFSDTLPIHIQHERIRGLFKASDSCLWVISYGGIDRILLNENYLPTGILESLHYQQNYFECVAACPEGHLLGSQDGIALFSETDVGNGHGNILPISEIIPTALCLDKDTNLWAGSTMGVYFFKRHRGLINPYQLKYHFTAENSQLTSNYINHILMDRTGILWFGTKAGGVCLLNPHQNRFNHIPLIRDSRGKVHRVRLRAIHQDRNRNIWIGTEDKELFCLRSPKVIPDFSMPFQHFAPNKESNWHSIFCVAEVSVPEGSQTWAGCSFPNTLITIPLNEDKLRIYPPPFPGSKATHMDILQGKDSIVWLARYQGGLVRYHPYQNSSQPEVFTTTNSKLPSDIVRSLMEDDLGNLWIGTGNGLCVLPYHQKRKEKPVFKVYQHISNDSLSISHNYVLRILQTLTGEIWIGTLGGGLNKYIPSSHNRPEHFLHLSTRDGLPNNNIKEILEDNKGNLWIASNRGLTRYNPYSGKINNYDISDGLQDNEFGEMAGFKLNTGQLLIGGVNGLNAFFPKDIIEDTTSPKVVITGFQIFNTDIQVNQSYNNRIILKNSIDQTRHIKLKYTENNITFHFSGLHFASSHKNRYKYHLEGFDKSWNSTTAQSRFAKYTNLDHGGYIFRVKASNSDGVWSRSTKELRISIQLPFWKTWLFQILASVGIVVGLILFFRFRFQQLRSEISRQKEQESVLTEAKRKAEESDNLKSSILANLSHEIRTPINGINGFAQILTKNNLSLERRKHFSKIIREKSNELTAILDSILYVSAVHSGNIKIKEQKRPIGTSLMEATMAAKDKVLSENKPITVHLSKNMPDLKQAVTTDHYKVLIILNNLLDNAIKFTEMGNINISCVIKGDFIEYAVSDTGIGIAEAHKELIFGEFQQGSTGHSRKYEGLGLGLALCRSYVVILGGKIWLESEEGKGSTFYFTIPYRR